MAIEGQTEDSLKGRILGRYYIAEKIGAGGMGEVYRARDERLERAVAVKVLYKRTILYGQMRKLLLKEAMALSKLNHSNIATIYDFDTQNGHDFLVMEYVNGQTLARRIAASQLSEKEVATWGGQVADALEEAHERGIIHRDLKPANIAITPKGQVKVLDFGLAKLFDPERGGLKAETLTQSVEESRLMGTLPYMAPEQVSGKHVDTRTDIYALGVILYEMTTRKRPFPDASVAQLFDAILHQAVLQPRVINMNISVEMERIILKCLEREPDSRYQSARELRVDLHRLLTASGAMPLGPAYRRRQGRQAIGSIAILPLINSNADPETEYVSDGITEGLINSLSRLPNLRVMARSTVFRYRDSVAEPLVVGLALGVGAVLTGKLVQRGEDLCISTELVNVSDGTHIWGEQYRRKWGDIFTLQEEIATEISSRLRLRLSGKEKKQLAKRYTDNREAYHAYLRGRYMASK